MSVSTVCTLIHIMLIVQNIHLLALTVISLSPLSALRLVSSVFPVTYLVRNCVSSVHISNKKGLSSGMWSFLQVNTGESLPWVPAWRLLQSGNPTTSSGQMLPEGEHTFEMFVFFSFFFGSAGSQSHDWSQHGKNVCYFSGWFEVKVKVCHIIECLQRWWNITVLVREAGRKRGRERGHLAVWDGIKQFADLCWFLDVLFFGGQGVRGGQSVDGEHPVDIAEHDEVFLFGDKLDLTHNTADHCRHQHQHWTVQIVDITPYHAPLWLSFVCSQVLNIRGKAFVQPQVIPPPQGHQITKPLKGKHTKNQK